MRPLPVYANGKPYKELVKIAQPPIIRRAGSFVMPGVLMQNHVQ